MGVKASKTGGKASRDVKNGVKKSNNFARKQSELHDDPETVVVRGGSIETISLSQDGRRKSSLSPNLDRSDKNSISPAYDGARKNSITPTTKRVRTSSDGGGSATAPARRTNSARTGRRPSFNPVVSSHSPALENGGGSPAISIGQLTPESALYDSPSGAQPGGQPGGLPVRNGVVNRQQSVGSVSTLCRSRPGSTTSAGRLPRIRYLEDNSRVFVDTLHMKALTPMPCSAEACHGSILTPPPEKRHGAMRSKEDMLVHSKNFLDQYFASIKRLHTPAHQKRMTEVQDSIKTTGTYSLSYPELVFGARTAWRNAARCIGRIQWNKLQVFDARDITTTRGMFEAICDHIRYATNRGNIRSTITVFPCRAEGRGDFRLWNAQLIRYAGYKQPDGTVIGDPSNVDFTEVCTQMGWRGKNGMFDLLPLVLQANGTDPNMYELPRDLVLEVPLKHPRFPWFQELGLKWYALPAVCGLMLDCGGLEFTAIPFNGWYMGTEVARDICDKTRYNMIERVASRMGLDMRTTSSLWMDLAYAEVNVAVLFSYQAAGVTMIDHHMAAESFMKHMENEYNVRGGCPADWVWIVPPMSTTLLPVFHQEMLNYHLKPNYEYLDEPWKTHVWQKERLDPNSPFHRTPSKKLTFREVARAVKFSTKLMCRAMAKRVKCTILYATETGKSERYAKTLGEMFKMAFDAKVVCMQDYDVTELEHETMLLVVTSTFGNGDPPENGMEFAKSLYVLAYPELADSEGPNTYFKRLAVSSHESSRRQSVRSIHGDQSLILANVRFSVFALGSRVYPNFCAFGKYVDAIMAELGAERVYPLTEGDELCGQEQSFNEWSHELLKAALDCFCIKDVGIASAAHLLAKSDLSWAPGRYRLSPDKEPQVPRHEALSKLHKKHVLPCQLVNRKNLQADNSVRQTLQVILAMKEHVDALKYEPGDHVAIFPANPQRLIERVIDALQGSPSVDEPQQLEIMRERVTPLGAMKTWEVDERYQTCTLREALTYYLDLTTPPSQVILQQMANLVTSDVEQAKLEKLSQETKMYDDWRHDRYPNLADILDEFPSLRLPPTFLLTLFPLIQPRFYSISSSLKVTPGHIHLTVAVLQFKTEGGLGRLHKGLCSNYLNDLPVGAQVYCYVRSAQYFHLPEDTSLPIILVGPGTGIAPFRSFWQQRQADKENIIQKSKKPEFGDLDIYFGCREMRRDNLYAEERALAKAEGIISSNSTAFSREANIPKTYVQDLLKSKSADVYRKLVKSRGHLYVCGDVTMAADVIETVTKIFEDEGGMSQAEAKNNIIKMKEENRLHEDIFGVTLRTSEMRKKARDSAKRNWKFISSATKLARSLSQKNPRTTASAIAAAAAAASDSSKKPDTGTASPGSKQATGDRAKSGSTLNVKAGKLLSRSRSKKS